MLKDNAAVDNGQRARAADILFPELARELLAAGVPVIACTPSPRRGRELDQPDGWSVMTTDDARTQLAHEYLPGQSVLAFVTGHGVDVLDVDTKAPTYGSVDNLPPGVETFGEHRTPSDGAHRFVHSTGFATIHGWGTSAGEVGDYLGGTEEGGGRALCYFHGPRPKYKGKSYTVVEPLDLGRLLEADPDPELVTSLANAGGRRRGQAGKRAASLHELKTFRSAHEQLDSRVRCAYGTAALQRMLDAAPTTPGTGKKGRHGWCVRSMVRVVELITDGCLTTTALDAVAAKLAQVKRDGDTDPRLCEAWAWTNAHGHTACDIHKPGGYLDRKRGQAS